MATIKFGGAITDARGSLAGNVFSRNRGGSYMRQRVTPTNPNTARQAAVRASFGSLQSNWRNLTEAQRDSWRNNAVNFPGKNRLGDVITYAGNTLYQKCNMVLLSAGLPLIETCPVSPAQVTEMTPQPPREWESEIGSGVITATTGKIKFLLASSAVKSEDVLNVYASAAVSAGRKASSSTPRRLIASIPSADWDVLDKEITVDVTTVYNAQFALGPTIYNGDAAITITTEVFNENEGYTIPMGVFNIPVKYTTP